MDKLANIEEIISYVEKAYDGLKEAEESWYEDVLSEELEYKIIEIKEELEEILCSLKDRERELETER